MEKLLLINFNIAKRAEQNSKDPGLPGEALLDADVSGVSHVS